MRCKCRLIYRYGVSYGMTKHGATLFLRAVFLLRNTERGVKCFKKIYSEGVSGM